LTENVAVADDEPIERDVPKTRPSGPHGAAGEVFAVVVVAWSLPFGDVCVVVEPVPPSPDGAGGCSVAVDELASLLPPSPADGVVSDAGAGAAASAVPELPAAPALESDVAAAAGGSELAELLLPTSATAVPANTPKAQIARRAPVARADGPRPHAFLSQLMMYLPQWPQRPA
jgi:hypothetical protein